MSTSSTVFRRVKMRLQIPALGDSLARHDACLSRVPLRPWCTEKGPPLAIKHRPLTLFLITIKELHQPPEDHADPSVQMVLTRLGSARATKPAPA